MFRAAVGEALKANQLRAGFEVSNLFGWFGSLLRMSAVDTRPGTYTNFCSGRGRVQAACAVVLFYLVAAAVVGMLELRLSGAYGIFSGGRLRSSQSLAQSPQSQARMIRRQSCNITS